MCMDENKLLNEIGKLIDAKLEQKLKPIQQDISEMKLEQRTIRHDITSQKLLQSTIIHGINNIKVELIDVRDRLTNVELKIELVNNKIDKTQEETIEVLSELIQNGYKKHEKRIKRLETHLNLPQP